MTWIGQIVILYNTSKVTAADSPKDWPDLTDPKWKDKMAVGSPNYSGIIGVWTVAMEQKYGWGYFEKLAKLNPLIGRSSDDPTTVLNSGERIVAAGNPSSALRSAALGNPLAVNYPTGGTLVDYSPTAIIKGAKNPNAAKLWMEFLASKEFSQVLADEFRAAAAPGRAAAERREVVGRVHAPLAVDRGDREAVADRPEEMARHVQRLTAALSVTRRPTAALAAPTPLRLRRVDPAMLVWVAVLVALLFLVVSPVGTLVLSSFRDTDTGAFTFDNYVTAYGRARDFAGARQLAALRGGDDGAGGASSPCRSPGACRAPTCPARAWSG